MLRLSTYPSPSSNDYTATSRNLSSVTSSLHSITFHSVRVMRRAPSQRFGAFWSQPRTVLPPRFQSPVRPSNSSPLHSLLGPLPPVFLRPAG